MRLPHDVLLRSLWVMGASGAGKTTALLSWACDLLRSGQAIGVIDPADDFVFALLRQIVRMPKRVQERILVWYPLHLTHSIGFNPLEALPTTELARLASFLAQLIANLFAADPNAVPRMQQILNMSFWLLARSHLTLVELPRLLIDAEFRAALLARLTEQDAEVEDFWHFEFPHENVRLAKEWIQSSANKIRPLVTDPALRRIFGQVKSGFSLRQVMDEGISLFVPLSKGVFQRQADLFGAFLLSILQLTAYSRQDMPEAERRAWICLVDEFHHMLTEDIEVILTQTRKFGFGLVLVNQHLAQLQDAPKLQSTLLNSVACRALFQTGNEDAERTMWDMFLPSMNVVKDTRVRKNPTGISFWPYETVVDRVYRPRDEVWELEKRKLLTLKPHEFWFWQRGEGAARKLRTRFPPVVQQTPTIETAVWQLINQSAQRYGRPHAEVDAEIAARRAELGMNDGEDDEDLLDDEPVEPEV
jgi:hypothetical protein